MSNLPVYLRVIRTSFREDGANPTRVLAAAFFMALRLALIGAIYKVAYDLTSTSSEVNLPYANSVWCIASYMVIVMGLGIRLVFKKIDEEVKTGKVETGLIQPLDWRLVKLCQIVGQGVVEVAILIPASLLTLWLFVGTPDLSYVSPLFVVGYIVLLLLALLAIAAVYVTVGLSAFWLNDALPVYRLVDKLILIFAGAWVPVALLPAVVQEVLRYSPMGVFAAITQFFNPGLVKNMLPTLVAAVFWVVVMLALCQLVWRRAQRRIEVNGG